MRAPESGSAEGIRVRARVGAFLALLSMWLVGASTTASAQQIQYAEPVQLAVADSRAEFEAYGRRFSLQLADNERALQKFSTQRKQELQRYRLLRGVIDGEAGSWVRLTETPAGLEGAIWDGRELYAVSTYGRVADLLSTPMDADPRQTVIYRLSDTHDVLPRDFCALEPDAPALRKQSALDQYQSLVTSLAALTPGTIDSQIEVALIADSAFATAESADPTAAMLARFNIVEGIFSEQLGLLVLATDLRVLPANEDSFTSTNAATLLEQFGAWRASNATIRARALAHLMTGRKLDGTTAGIAYLNSACSAEHGASLSSRSYGTTISALIMAHELGHNLGAPHDGEAGACSATGGGFIMAPTVSGYTNFSSCSVQTIRASIEQSACVTPASYADVGVSTPDGRINADAGVPFTLPFVLRGSGTLAATDVVLDLSLPENAGLTLDSVSGEGAGCSINGLTATCQFGSVAPGERRAFSAIARGTLAGSITARARVSASNDPLTSNNTRSIEVSLRSGIDAAVIVTTDQAEVAVGAPLQVYAEVRSLRALAVRNAVVSLNLNQPVNSASMPGASCVVNASAVVCNVTEIAGGSAATLSVSTTATTAGPLFAAASVTVSGDGELSNNTAHGNAWIQAERDIELTAGPASVELDVGDSYEIPMLLRSRGTQSATDVALAFQVHSDAVEVDVVDAAGGSCVLNAGSGWQCQFGTLAAGEARLVRVRVRGLRAGSVMITARADAASDGYFGNNVAGLQLDIDNAVDLGLMMGSGGSGIEGNDVTGQMSLRSNGRESARNGTVEVELHAAGVLRAVSIHDGADCELLSPQRARCVLPAVASGSNLFIDYRAQFETPGAYDVKYTLTVPGDTAPDNDSLTRPIVIRPYYDIAVDGDLNLSRFMVGEKREVTFTVRAGRRALATARLVVRHEAPGIRVRAIRASAGDCRVDDDVGGICDFTDFAAEANASVVVTLEAVSACRQDISVAVSTQGDVLANNDAVSARIDVLGPTDLELRVAAAASGTAGTTFAFPAISLVNGTSVAVGTRLEVTLPAEVTLVSLSANDAICSGTAVLRCDFADLDANSTAIVNITVRGSIGNYLSTVKLASLNDTNPANDSGQVALDITGVQSTPAPASNSGGGGGGGGRLEWLLLAACAALVLRKAAHARGARRTS